MAILRKLFIPLALFFVFHTGLGAPVHADPELIRLHERKIKAGLLYNFLKYSHWPEESGRTNDVFRVCLLGGDPFDGMLDPVQGRTAQQRSISIIRLSGTDRLASCHVVVVDESASKNIPFVLNAAQKYRILTVSDLTGFSAKGGMVEFSRSPDSRIRLFINRAAIAGANLQVGEQILKLSEAGE